MTIQQIPHYFVEKVGSNFSEMIMDTADNVGEKTAIACLNIKYGAWKFFLNFSEVQNVLVFDTTLGLDTLAVSECVRSVVTVCHNTTMSNILMGRFREESVSNADVVECQIDSLPFSDNSFDLIICRDAELLMSFLDANTSVERVYDELDRILCDNGSLFLCLNKRPVFGIFNPQVESFKNIKNQQKILLRIFKNKKYITNDIIYCLPEQFYIDELISQKIKPNLIRDNFTFKSKVKNTLIKKLYPHFSPNTNYLLSRRKKPAGRPLYQSILEATFSILDIQNSDFQLKRMLVGNPNTLLMLIGGNEEGYVIRVPMCKDSRARLENQYTVLNTLSSMTLKGGRQLPRVYPPFTIENQLVYVEEMLEGVVLDDEHLLSISSESIAIDWLLSFHSNTSVKRKMSPLDIDEQLKAPFVILSNYSRNNHEYEIFEKLNSYICEKFINKQRFQFVCMHGDFKIENMLFSPDHKEVTGIFDWDLAKISGLPLVDLLYFLAYCDKLRGSDSTIPELIFDKFIVGHMTAREEKKVSDYVSKFSIPMSDLKDYALMACVYHVVYRIDHNDKYWGQTYEVNIGKLLVQLDELFDFPDKGQRNG